MEFKNVQDVQRASKRMIDGIKNEIASYEKGLASLYDKQGRPNHAAHIMEQRKKQYEAALADFLALRADEINGWRLQAEAERVLALTDPMTRITHDELQRANLLADFVREACAKLPLDTLAVRLRATAAGGDTPTRLLYARYAEQRRLALDESILTATVGDQTAVVVGSAQDRTGYAEFSAALDSLKDVAMPQMIADSASIAVALSDAATEAEIALAESDPTKRQRAEQAAKTMAGRF